MLTRIQNELGAISIDENIIAEAVNELIQSFGGRVRAYRNSQNRQIRMLDDGVYVHIELVLKMGTSISEVSSVFIDSLVRLITRQVGLEVSNIEVKIAGMQSFGRVMPRDILYDYKSGLVRWNEQ